MDPHKKSIYIPNQSSIQQISCQKAFSNLSPKEKIYSYYFTRACWSGCKICYFQRSFEAPALFYLFYRIFELESPTKIREKLKNNEYSDDEIQKIFVYIGSFFQNCGNYLSFGDVKFIPEIPKEKFLKFIQLSEAEKKYANQFNLIWINIEKALYEVNPPFWEIGLPDENGLSPYYSTNITRQNTDLIKDFLKQQGISQLNTRIIKLNEKEYEVRIASVNVSIKKFVYLNDISIALVYGDFSSFLNQVSLNLEKTLPFVSNEHQKLMITSYIKHFETGDIEIHKESQRHWIADQGPIIETNIGFIEVYLDPLKNRAEWEGFVSIVDKEKSKILGNLVEKAQDFIKLLTWGKDFEVDEFKRPDFTSLEILTFASSGTPIGINIPNYDDIRQNFGFKNVDLGNAYGEMKEERILFTDPNLKTIYAKYYKDSLFVVVALHELLGHGTGKLFTKNINGKLNFDENLINPLTNQKISTYYEDGEDWHSKFGDLSGAYEECRADAVALYLSTFDEILDVLLPAHSSEEKEQILICCWYDVIYGAVRGLKEFSPESMKWGQAHMGGNYAILKTIIDADPDMIHFREVAPPEGKQSYMMIDFDHSKIKTAGRKAIGHFLQKLQIYKSIADYKNGLSFFENMLKVNEDMLKWRKIVLENNLPRRIESFDDVKLSQDGKDVEYISFKADFEGLILSHIYHYQGDIDDVYDYWVKDIQHFKKN